MSIGTRFPIVTAFALVLAVTAAGTFAQDAPAPPSSLSGTYELGTPSLDEQTATMSFKATITNNGDKDLSGPIVLRHPNVVGKVWARFGDQTIPAGKSVMVMSTVTVPRSEYDGWLSGGSPAVFFYMQNDRGDVKTYRIAMSRIALPAPSS